MRRQALLNIALPADKNCVELNQELQRQYLFFSQARWGRVCRLRLLYTGVALVSV